MAQFHKGNIVMKAGESECKAKMKEGQELDYFNSEKSPTKLPLIAAEVEEEEEEQDPNLAAEAIERVMELLETCDVDGAAAAFAVMRRPPQQQLRLIECELSTTWKLSKAQRRKGLPRRRASKRRGSSGGTRQARRGRRRRRGGRWRLAGASARRGRASR